jgi:predicted HAD superfamily Cof-like phosphohydrolase
VTRVFEMLAEFHAALGEAYGHGSVHDSSLRRKLHVEEHDELIEAIDAKDLIAIAHELADVIYVAYGTAYSLGIPIDAVINEVHRANMSKFDADGRPVLRDDGKLLKSDRFTPADVARILEWAGATS